MSTKQKTKLTANPIVICSGCGKENVIGDSARYCVRCSAITMLMGSELHLESLAECFWDTCFNCGAEIIAHIELVEDNLTIQCDNCGETHVIPFAPADIIRYIRSGIVRENVID